VQPDGFNISVVSSTLNVPENRSTLLNIKVTRATGFTQPVTFSLEGAPSEMTAAFSPNPLTSTANTSSVSLTLRTGDPSQDTFALTIKATAGKIVRTIPLTLTVTERINGSGSLDTSFGAGGFVTLNLPGNTSRITALTVQSDGKIVAVGPSDNSNTRNFIVVRLNPDGSPDFSFDGDGLLTVDFGGSDEATAVAVQPDGKIVVAGWSAGPGGNDVNLAVARINTNGSFDSFFHGDGKVVTDNGVDLELKDVVLTLQSDGKIIVAGPNAVTGEAKKLVMVRYASDGNLDTTFGTGGIVLNAKPPEVQSLFLQPDGKIVVVNANVFGLTIARFNTNGTLDLSFGGGDGIAVGSNPNVSSSAMLLQGDKLVGLRSGLAAGLVRVNLADATLDTSFGTGGIADTGFGTSLSGAVAAQTDGKLIFAGTTSVSNTVPAFALARFNTNGSLDTSFGAGGRVATNFPLVGGGNNAQESAREVAIQSDGKIILAGQSAGGEFSFVRYLP
jgi:uncharacterized delta-60 repeat protein